MEIECPFCKEKIEKLYKYVQRCTSCGYFFENDKKDPEILYSKAVAKVGDVIIIDECPTTKGKWKNLNEPEIDKIAKDLAKNFSLKELEAALYNKPLGDSVHCQLTKNFKNYTQLIANFVLERAIYHAKKNYKPTIFQVVKVKN